MIENKLEAKRASWNCQDIDIPHSSSFVHEKGMEDGLPNYHAQLDDKIRITVCSSCHPRIPGHIINIRPDDIEQYFEIEDVDDLFRALPEGYTSSGYRETYRKKVFMYSMNDEFNPYPDHAGKTLRISLGYQWDKDEWKPDEDVIEPMHQDSFENWSDKYSEKY